MASSLAIERNQELSVIKSGVSNVDDLTEKVALLWSTYNSNHIDEINRLEKLPFIYELKDKVENFSLMEKIAFYHTLELNETIQKTHYVFNHAVNNKLAFLHLVFTELKKTQDPSNELHIQMRSETFLRSVPDLLKNPDWYHKYRINDHMYNGILVSADCNLSNDVICESALSFLKTAKNMLLFLKKGDDFLRENLKIELDSYDLSEDEKSEFIRNIIEISNQLEDAASLYSICVPKDVFEKVGFFSAPLGFALDIKKIKEKKEPIVQVRLISSYLQPKNDILVLAHYTFDNEKLIMIKDQVESAVKILVSKGSNSFLKKIQIVNFPEILEKIKGKPTKQDKK